MSMEDGNHAPQASAEPSSSSSPLERRPSGDEDSAAMTIEYLRARLLSERSVSKAARQRALLLSKKVSELEERLEQEIQLRKRLEADRLEILLKYRAELSEDYGDFFASNFGEGFPRDESAPDSPNSRKNDTSNQDEDGVSSSRLEPLDRSDSSQHLTCEEANDEDDEIDHSGREKGVLSWGRRKGSRKDFNYGADWPGRSLSQRSLASADSESPQKKWAGKSVRQIRKKENRSYDTNFEGENSGPLVSEGSDGRVARSNEMREPLPCEDERDTEVERVLGQQAELIEQYEAEEKAQTAWEAKFKERKALIDHENGITPCNSAGKLDDMTRSVSLEREFMAAKDDVTKLGGKASNILSPFSNDNHTRNSRKVHPMDLTSKLEEIQAGQMQSEAHHNNALQDLVATDAPEDTATYSSVDHSTVGLPEGLHFTTEESTEAIKMSDLRKEDQPIGKMFPNMETEPSIDHSTQPTIEVGKTGKYKKHLSSSFKFAVLPDAEQATGSSPQMQGFATCKKDSDQGERWEKVGLSVEASGQVSTPGLSDALHHDRHNHDIPTALPDDEMGANHLSRNHAAAIEDTESQEKGKDLLEDEIPGREKVSSHMASTNGVTESFLDVNSSSNIEGNSFKADLNRGMKGEHNIQPGKDGPLSYSSSHLEPKDPGSSEYLPLRHRSDFSSHPDYSLQPPRDVDGATSDNLALYPGYRSGIQGPSFHGTAYEEMARGSNRRLMDGLDRVADVLRALQIAKLQIQCSKEEDAPGSDWNADSSRDVFYSEPPRLPPVYASRDAFYAESSRLESPTIYGAGKPPFVTSVPYSSRGPTSYTHNMHGWSASGYGVGSSRQVPSASYMHYPSRMLETQNLWSPPPPLPPPPPPPPPSHGVYNGNLYHYDTRHHR